MRHVNLQVTWYTLKLKLTQNKTNIFQIIYSLIHYLTLPREAEPSDRYCPLTLEWTFKADV